MALTDSDDGASSIHSTTDESNLEEEEGEHGLDTELEESDTASEAA